MENNADVTIRPQRQDDGRDVFQDNAKELFAAKVRLLTAERADINAKVRRWDHGAWLWAYTSS